MSVLAPVCASVRPLSPKARLSLMVVFILMLSAFAVGAQSTPVPMEVSDYISGASDLVNTFNLFPLIAVAAIVGVAVMLVARFRRAAK